MPGMPKKTSPVIFAVFLVIGLCLGCSSMASICRMGFMNKPKPAPKKR
jgi:F0F1-type ATP synthase assembly protein I